MLNNYASAVHEAAKRSGVEEAKLLALISVESVGKPFEDADIDLPRLLFERHKFYALLPEDRREAASVAGIANARWLPKTQYRDQATSEGRIKLLTKAITWWHDPEIPHQACSWGLMQIMGFNHAKAGYASAVAMVDGFKTVEGQIDGSLEFMRSEGLFVPLKAGLWAQFAKGFNGPDYAKNKYDTRLALAYERFKKEMH